MQSPSKLCHGFDKEMAMHFVESGVLQNYAILLTFGLIKQLKNKGLGIKR
jgi:hypothetical protein